MRESYYGYNGDNSAVVWNIVQPAPAITVKRCITVKRMWAECAIPINRPNMAVRATGNLLEASSVMIATEIVVTPAFIGGLEMELIESQRDTQI
jgi:hypothetical protein